VIDAGSTYSSILIARFWSTKSLVVPYIFH
jgi:hypothetical protein